MISKQHQEHILNELDTKVGVQDAYFYKGKLYVVNLYDMVAVEEYLDETGWAADVDWLHIEEETT